MNDIEKILSGKTQQEVLKAIRTGEILQYNASQDQITSAVSKALGCTHWNALKLITQSNLRRAKDFSADMDAFALHNLFASF